MYVSCNCPDFQDALIKASIGILFVLRSWSGGVKKDHLCIADSDVQPLSKDLPISDRFHQPSASLRECCYDQSFLLRTYSIESCINMYLKYTTKCVYCSNQRCVYVI